jgi:hypothetical protein
VLVVSGTFILKTLPNLKKVRFLKALCSKCSRNIQYR